MKVSQEAQELLEKMHIGKLTHGGRTPEKKFGAKVLVLMGIITEIIGT